MSTWNFDISAAPRDRDIWLATKCGSVLKSYWIEKSGARRWAGLGTKEQPVAWQLFTIPAHPNAVSDLGLNIITKHSEIQANPEEVGAHGSRDEAVPAVDAGSRPAIGRSMAATSEKKDVTGGESAATHSNSGGHQASCPSLATREAEESVVSFPKAETSLEAAPASGAVTAQSGADASKVVCPALIDECGSAA